MDVVFVKRVVDRSRLLIMLGALLCVVVVLSITVGCTSDTSQGDDETTTTDSSPTTTTTTDSSPATAVAERVLPSVVAVIAQNEQGQQVGLGSGVIYSPDGVIVTNNHVVVAGNDQPVPRLTVRLASGEELTATLLGRDPISDLAVLRVERQDLPAAEFVQDFSTVKVGQYAIAIGSPLGLEGTVTLGIVSAIQRELPAQGSLGAVDLVQTDAPISPGNSGGALADEQGRVIGINVAAIPPSAETRAQSINFAIPSDLVITVIEQVLEEGEVRYGYLGIQSVPITPDLQEQYELSRADGVLVLGVASGSPASQGGLEPGDIIVAIAGGEVRGQTDLYSVLRERRPGETVEIAIVRGETEQTLSVTLGERPVG